MNSDDWVMLLIGVLVVGTIPTIVIIAINQPHHILAEGELTGKYKRETCSTQFYMIDDNMYSQLVCTWDYYFIIDETSYPVSVKAYESFQEGDLIQIWSDQSVTIQGSGN